MLMPENSSTSCNIPRIVLSLIVLSYQVVELQQECSGAKHEGRANPGRDGG